MGWALKATQKRPHLEEKVKANLIEKFEAGERSGTKADPLSVLREMKLKRDGKGKLVFQPEEWKMECWKRHVLDQLHWLVIEGRHNSAFERINMYVLTKSFI